MSFARFVPLAVAALAFWPGGAVAGGPQISVHMIQTQALSSVSDYWTPERRAAALPRDMFISGALAPVSKTTFPSEPVRTAPGALPQLKMTSTATGAPETGPGQDQADNPAPNLDETAALASGQYPYAFSRNNVNTSLYKGSGAKFPYTAVGKLFFTLFGVNYVCSASVIRPHVLLTARHCVYDYASKQWAVNVVFYPGYYNGTNSALGAWYAKALITHTSGADGWDYDIGLIQTYNKKRTGCKATSSNKQIESYTGYLGYKYGGTYANRQFTDLGYPQAWPFTGKVMVQCSAKTGAVNSRGVTNTVEIGCDQTGGCSGGPWLNNLAAGSAASSKNQATSVNSFRWSDRPLAINGPQFMTNNFYKLLQKATSLACQ